MVRSDIDRRMALSLRRTRAWRGPVTTNGPITARQGVRTSVMLEDRAMGHGYPMEILLQGN
jgi:hypothetical protein